MLVISVDKIPIKMTIPRLRWPIAWFAMANYLQEFYYRIDVPWWVIPATALLMLAITLAIVFIQTFRAARANPVVGLRRE